MTEFKQLLLSGEQHLAKDPIMQSLIEQFGHCVIEPHSDHYQELFESIISQQLSVKAAAAILGRTRALFDGRTPLPEQLVQVDDEILRAAGNSYSKIRYMKSLADNVLDGSLELDKLQKLDNEKVIAELTQVKGIGVWSAHMFMMFSLGRLDILAVGDLGIQNAVGRLYLAGTKAAPAQVTEIAELNHWAPFQTIACWYLWRSLDNMPKS